MATAAAAAPTKGPKEYQFSWEGKDKSGKVVRGELRAVSDVAVNATLRRQGITGAKVKQIKAKSGGSVGSKDLTPFTPHLPTIMKPGWPLLQPFETVGKGASNPRVARLRFAIKTDGGTGHPSNPRFPQ